MMGNNTTTLTPIEQLLQEVKSLHKKIDEIREEKIFEGIEEISQGKAAKLLHRGEASLLELVGTKQLKGMPYKTKGGEIRYRFRLSDIKAFQKSEMEKIPEDLVEYESAESIAKRIFKGGKRGNN